VTGAAKRWPRAGRWDLVIVDEAHKCKNHLPARYKLLQEIPPKLPAAAHWDAAPERSPRASGTDDLGYQGPKLAWGPDLYGAPAIAPPLVRRLLRLATGSFRIA
jgi:hypothetical protein